LYAPGHAGCPGCGPSTTMIQVADALGRNAIIVNATGCMEITSSQYPSSAWRVPYIHVLFENAAAVASGIAAALRACGDEKTRVAVIAGDGATYDIGFGALSGMLERGDDVLYVCYNNEIYANTGVQKSGATPFGAATTTTPAGSKLHGKTTDRKPLFEIVAAHEPVYAATASVAFIADLKNKLKKAVSLHGPRFIDVYAPCALGAGFDGGLTAQVARLAVQTRAWPLLEYENGVVKLNFNPTPPKPVEEYLKLQKRFKHLTPEDVEQVQKRVDAYWEKLLKKIEK